MYTSKINILSYFDLFKRDINFITIKIQWERNFRKVTRTTGKHVLYSLSETLKFDLCCKCLWRS